MYIPNAKQPSHPIIDKVARVDKIRYVAFDILTNGPIGSRRSSKVMNWRNGRVSHFHAFFTEKGNGSDTMRSNAMPIKMIVAGKSVLVEGQGNFAIASKESTINPRTANCSTFGNLEKHILRI